MERAGMRLFSPQAPPPREAHQSSLSSRWRSDHVRPRLGFLTSGPVALSRVWGLDVWKVNSASPHAKGTPNANEGARPNPPLKPDPK
eukprot:scaffold22630_cov29-Tisochrysis_lutea.AAC.4